MGAACTCSNDVETNHPSPRLLNRANSEKYVQHQYDAIHTNIPTYCMQCKDFIYGKGKQVKPFEFVLLGRHRCVPPAEDGSFEINRRDFLRSVLAHHLRCDNHAFDLVECAGPTSAESSKL